MTLESRASRVQPAGGRLVNTNPRQLADALTNITQLIRQPEPEPRVPPGGQDAFQFDAALDVVKDAAEAMAMMEGRSQQVQAKAHALAEQARQDARAASQQIVSLQQSLSDSEARTQNLEARLIEAEEQVRRANKWLTRFHDAITTAFASRRSPSSKTVAA